MLSQVAGESSWVGPWLVFAGVCVTAVASIVGARWTVKTRKENIEQHSDVHQALTKLSGHVLDANEKLDNIEQTMFHHFHWHRRKGDDVDAT